MSFPLIGDSIDIEDNLASLYVRMTSGQKSYFTKLTNIQTKHAEMMDELAHEFNTVVLNEFVNTISHLINHFYPLIPVDTGALRAAFVANFFIIVQAVNVGKFQDPTVALRMKFDMTKWMMEIPYARYHIEEIIGKSEYKTVKGKRPLDMDFFINIMGGLTNRLMVALSRSGWYLEKSSQRQIGEQLNTEMIRVLEKWGVFV